MAKDFVLRVPEDFRGGKGRADGGIRHRQSRNIIIYWLLVGSNIGLEYVSHLLFA